MSTSIKVIKFTSIISILFLVITYLITVNIESGFIYLDTIWISNNFLLTVFGGAFASSLVVLLCEINKYLIDKENIESQLFFQSLYLYQALFLMQHNILDYQSHPNINIPENLFDHTTQMIKSQVYCLRGIDYASIRKGKKIERMHNEFKQDTFIKFSPLENGVNLLRCAILEERIENHEKDKPKPDYITSSNPKVATVLSEQMNQITALLEEVGIFIKTIDDNCKNRYNWDSYRNKFQNGYISLFRSDNE